MSTTTTPTAGSDRAASSLLDKPAYRSYVLLMLVFGYIFNVIDRSSVLDLLFKPLRRLAEPINISS